MRVGIGYDIHALKKGRALVLGGVRIPFSKGLSGHSDGDVLFHAAVDAVLGALAAGDIGDHFSDKGTRWKNTQSVVFVKKVNSMLRKRHLQVAHLDATVIAEQPKLIGFKEKIRKSVSKAFGIRASSVNVKAKTHEGFGAVGAGKAIACLVIASLKG